MNSAPTSSQPDLSGDDFGSYELDAIFSGDQPLTAIQQALAMEFLARSEEIQIERLQCIADGALLAAEQVQDVRLDLLEQGPEVSAQDVLMDIFIGFLLDSSLPGKLVKGFTSHISKRMVRRYSLLLEGERSKAATIMKNPRLLNNLSPKGTWRQPGWGSAKGKSTLAAPTVPKLSPALAEKGERKRNLELIEKMLDEELKSDEYLKAADRWRGLATRGSNSDTIKNATAALKAGYKKAKSKLDTKPLRIDGDTPGVALLGSVQEFIANSRMVVRFQYRRMATMIKIDEMTGAEARSFLRLAEFEPVEDSLKTIRDHCKLLFEAIIWAGIFKFDAGNRKISADGLHGIDQRLARYWIRRFGQDVHSWTERLGEQGRRNEGQDAIEDWSKAHYIQKLGTIERYFIKLLNDLPVTLKDAKALTSNFDPAASK